MQVKLSAKLVRIESGTNGYDGYEGVLRHWCPGCKTLHMFAVEKGFPGNGHKWSYNNDPEQPAFSPSMNISWGPYGPERKERRCHYYVRRGLEQLGENPNLSYIQYMSDTTHSLSNQTVLLPDIPEDEHFPR